MAFDPGNQREVLRLRSDIDRNANAMRPFVNRYDALVKRFAGDLYGENRGYDVEHESYRTPVNLISRAGLTYQMLLAGGTPQVTVTPPEPSKNPGALDVEAMVNEKLRVHSLRQTLPDAVMEAMFGVGCIKVGIDFGPMVGDYLDQEDFDVDPFADLVTMPDLILDLSVQRYEDMAFQGNRYRVPLDFFNEAVRRGFFSRKGAEGIQVKRNLHYTEYGDPTPHDMLGSWWAPEESHRPMVELMDVWLPRDRIIVTMAAGKDAETRHVLRVIDYQGPDSGPYYFLDFIRIPGLPMAKSMIAELLPLHDAVNRLIKKTIQQSIRQKTILGCPAGMTYDGEQVRDATDGQVVFMEDPSRVREYRFGGPDNQIEGTANYLESHFDRQGGNIATLAGLSNAAPTIGQEQILEGNAGKRIAYMRELVKNFSERVIRHLGWHWWNDSSGTFRTTRNLPEADITVPVTITPEQREATDLLRDYSIQVDPYSLGYKSPEERLQTIMQLMNFTAPLLPLMQQQGTSIDFRYLIQLLARLTNQPELNMLYQTVAPTPAQDSRALQSPVTERIRTERSQGGGRQQGSSGSNGRSQQQPAVSSPSG